MNNYIEVIENFRKWFLYFDKKKLKKEFYKKHCKPIRVQIEVSTLCNLNCFMCPRIELKEFKTMEFNFFKSIIDKLPSSVERICLSGLGEPFLNKELLKIAKYTKSKGFFVEIYTNGLTINKDVLDFIDLIVFSIDSPDEILLKELRKGIIPDKVFFNISEVVNLKRVKVGINFTANSLNYKTIPKVFDFCEKFKIDYLFIQPVNNNFAIGGENFYRFAKDLNRLKIVDWHYIVNNYKKEYSFNLTIWYPREMKGLCAWGFSNFYINIDGDIITCCRRVTRPIRFGNLFEKNFNEIIKNMEWFRNVHLLDKKFRFCDLCY